MTLISKKDDLKLEEDNNNDIELMLNRAIIILEKDNWNIRNFIDDNI